MMKPVVASSTSRVSGSDVTAPAAPDGRQPAGTGLAARAPSFALQPSDMLVNRYIVEASLARGGMGEVYRARDRELGESVALKIVRPDLVEGDPHLLTRFKREVQLARRIAHPNVCRTYDLHSDLHGSGHKLVFLTMELIAGETLADRLRESGRLSADDALTLALPIAAALQAAHRVGIVHRDLKPSNVMVTSSGPVPDRVVVTDFGLARLYVDAEAVGESCHGSTSGIIGTPAYMAPEQVEGDAVGPPADVYALGVVLFEMVTGRLPFDGSSPLQMAARRLTHRPPSPRSRAPELAESWEQTILACLERDPSARPDLSQVVARLRQDRPAAARRIRSVNELPAPVVRPDSATLLVKESRGRWKAPAILLPAIAGIVAVAGSAVGAYRGQTSPTSVEASRSASQPEALGDAEPELMPLTTTGDARSGAISPGGDRLLYQRGAVGKARLVVRAIDGGPETVVLEGGWIRAAWLDSDRVVVSAYIDDKPQLSTIDLADGSRRAMEGWSGTPRPNRDGSAIAFFRSAEPRLRIADPGGRPLSDYALSGQFDWLTWVDWSDSGRLLMSTRAGHDWTLWTMDGDGTGQRRLVDQTGAWLKPTWDAGGSSVVYLAGRDDGRASLRRITIDPSTGGPAGEPEVVLESIDALAGDAPDVRAGRLVLTRHQPRSNLWLAPLDIDAWQLGSAVRLTRGDDDIRDFAVSPDGRTVAYASGNTVWTVAKDGGPRQLVSSSGPPIDQLAWSPDGERIAFNRQASGGQRIWVVAASGGEPRALSGTLVGDHLTWAPHPRIAGRSPSAHNYSLVDPDSGAHDPLFATDAEEWVSGALPAPDARLMALHMHGLEGGQTDAVMGLVLVDLDSGERRSLADGEVFPIGWTGNSGSILALRHPAAGQSGELLRLPISPSEPPTASMPLPMEGVVSAAVTADQRQVIFLVDEGQSDVYTLYPWPRP